MSTLTRLVEISKKPMDMPSDQQEKKFMNCWEFTKCEKEDLCQAGINRDYDGYFKGKNGGRFCSFIKEETLCYDDEKRTTVEKLNLCMKCEFYHEIMKHAFPGYKKKEEFEKATEKSNT